MSIKFITDSASDMCEKDGVTVVPMTITFGNDEYKDGVTLSHREFMRNLLRVMSFLEQARYRLMI